MRLKNVIYVLLAGLAGVIGVYSLTHQADHPQPAATSISKQKIKPAAPQGSPTIPIANEPATLASVKTVVKNQTADTNELAEAHATFVQARIDKLNELGANDDAESLHVILAELTNSDKEIRTAAVESAIQFGSRDAIPVLKELAARTLDPDEKKELLDAAEFLSLPTLSEVRVETPAAK